MKVENTGGSVIRLHEGIYLIPGRRSGGCNVFVLRGSHKTLLIDLGLPGDYPYLCQSLKGIGLCIDDIDMVVISHEHIDHAGCLPELPRRIVVAAHGRAAAKFQHDDQFSMMSGAFGTRGNSFHVDVQLEDGALIDLGGIKLRVIYTPGHCSGAICLYEPRLGALFTADTVFAGGVLGGIFASGNISDYIDSLERLLEFHLLAMYPGHGRMSTSPRADIERAISGSRLLMSDTQSLFEAVDIRNAFKNIKSAAVDYSRRAAERRAAPRSPIDVNAFIHLPDADHPVHAVNVSLLGIRLDRELPLPKAASVSLTLEGIGDFNCQVVTHAGHHTRLRIDKSSRGMDNLMTWLSDVQRPTASARK